MIRKQTYRLVLAAMFLALGMLLPFLTGQIKEIGDSLLPMHLAVLLCGALCGADFGLYVGAVLPFLRSVTFGMPPIYPNAVWMSLELATYGLVMGFLLSKKNKTSVGYLYFSLIVSMISGRIVWGISKAFLLGVANKPFGIEAFIVGGFLDAIPGIVLQLIAIPAILKLVNAKHLKGEKK